MPADGPASPPRAERPAYTEVWSRRSKLSELMAQHFIREIAEQRLRPGDRLLSESAMLQEFGVGRATLRECLRLLESYGLIVMRSGPRGGPTVVQPDAAAIARSITVYLQVNGVRFRDLIDARVILEPIMARLAAEHVTPESSARFDEILAAGADPEASSRDRLHANVDFHLAVNSASGNGVLDLFAHALNEIYLARRITVNDQSPDTAFEQTQREHEAIGRAIVAGKPAVAERLMHRHITEMADGFRTLYPWMLDTIIDISTRRDAVWQPPS